MRLDDLVRENYDRMGESDHRIWQYICSHTEECRRLSLHQLAEACEVSHTTVSRFLHLIGMFSLFSSLCRTLFFLLPLAALFTFFYPAGVWFSFPIAEALALLISVFFYHKFAKARINALA